MRPLLSKLTEAAEELARLPGEIRRHRARPPRSGLVLDVGGGQHAHPRADVVVDKYVVDDFERSGAMSLDASRPLVIADGHALPFRAQAFAYVIASHVLEHAGDPIRFATELSRVAPRGYAEMPSREAELTFGWPFHPWLVDREDDTLIFTPKEEDAPCGSFFHREFAASPLLQLWIAAHRSTWLHGVHWSGQLRVRVEGSSTASKSARVDLPETIAALERVAREGSLPPLSDRLWEMLRCPGCGASVDRTANGTLTCRGCRSSYPVAGGAPILLKEAAQRAAATPPSYDLTRSLRA